MIKNMQEQLTQINKQLVQMDKKQENKKAKPEGEN
jgi:hypothetical protein